MRRSAIVVAGFVLALTGIGTGSASADQAQLGLEYDDNMPTLAPGETFTWSSSLFMGESGLQNVVYDVGPGFVDGEVVTAMISPRAWAFRWSDWGADIKPPPRPYAGTVELLTSNTLTGTTEDWAEGTDLGFFEFAPRIELRYTVPSAEDLGCDGEDLIVWVGVDAEFVGDHGTRGHTDPLIEAVFPAFPAIVACPTAEPSARQPAPTSSAGAVEPTPPPTDAVREDSRRGTAGEWLWLALLAPLGVLLLLARARKPRRG